MISSHLMASEEKEIPTKEDKEKIKEAASSVSSETKRLLRRIGRKSMDETCGLTSDNKEECEKQKATHQELNKKEEEEGVD